jgi:hypothetical protein
MSTDFHSAESASDATSTSASLATGHRLAPSVRASAAVLPLPGALTQPLRQSRRGRLPKSVVSLWRARYDRSGFHQVIALELQLADIEERCLSQYRAYLEACQLEHEAAERSRLAFDAHATLRALRSDLKQRLAALAGATQEGA